MQTLVCTLAVLGAAWYVMGVLLPLHQRRLRGWLARLAAPWLPARVVTWLRPGFPVTHCGCGGACSGVAQRPAARAQR